MRGLLGVVAATLGLGISAFAYPHWRTSGRRWLNWKPTSLLQYGLLVGAALVLVALLVFV